MAVKTKKKSNVEVPTEELKITESEIQMIQIGSITANTAQSRGCGVLSRLQTLGYGLFEQIEVGKEPIWDMLASGKPEVRQQAITLIEEYEPELVALEKSTRQVQLQPIVVYSPDEGKSFDVVAGMRRTLAEVLASAREGKVDDALIEAKVLTFDRTPTKGDLKFLALKENDDRQEESPLDKAITFKELADQGYSTKEIGDKVGWSDQNVRNYLKLLIPEKSNGLKDGERQKLHTWDESKGKYKLSVDAALKIIQARKSGKDGPSREPSNGADRFRLPSVKGIMRIYDAPAKPEKMDEEEWELWILPDVRRFLAHKLGLKYSEWKPAPEKPAEKKDEPSANGNGKAGKVLAVKRERAVKLLIALGKTDARTWKDDKIASSLNSIVNLAEPGQKVEAEVQGLLNKLLEGYKDGLRVKIEPNKK